ncbi:DUF397 domain-containing protein [Streptomyces griseoaurantiacus]|uniref:DUF397 domain-containing protein n=1 Tax=Streptomyces griseoaurantiacus TaxID=68213 RepID=UPI00178189AE|nr:hypothetical protein GCM10018782_44070 [Streptomyces griseoaurantiacus]
MTSDNVIRGDARHPWIRSSYSSEEGGECVEVASSDRAIHVRDSKDTARPTLTLGRTAWSDFLRFATGRSI